VKGNDLVFKKIVNRFAETVIAQNTATMKADTATANRQAKKRSGLFKKLRAYGDDGREALSELFNHPRPDVREMAAVYLLRYKHKEAMAILKELSKRGDLVGFGAGQAIQRWNEGEWQIDPAD